MKTVIIANNERVKRFYKKPLVTRISIDNQISMVMMSSDNPPGDPIHVSINPFK